MLKQLVTINGRRTSTWRPATRAKARRWLDKCERVWRIDMITVAEAEAQRAAGGEFPLNQAVSVVRESADRLVIVNTDAETIVIENKVFAKLRLIRCGQGHASEDIRTALAARSTR